MVSVWIIGSLAVAVTSSSSRSCLRKSSITSPARVNRMQIKTMQNWNTTMGVGDRSMADVNRWQKYGRRQQVTEVWQTSTGDRSMADVNRWHETPVGDRSMADVNRWHETPVGDRSMADVNRWHETPVQLHMSTRMYQYGTVLIMNRKWDMVLSACRICRLWCDVMWCDVMWCPLTWQLGLNPFETIPLVPSLMVTRQFSLLCTCFQIYRFLGLHGNDHSDCGVLRISTSEVTRHTQTSQRNRLSPP